MAYDLIVSQRAARDLRGVPPRIRARLNETLRALALDPFPAGRKKLTASSPATWRVRVGDYRVVYRIDQERVTVLVLRAAHRSDVY